MRQSSATTPLLLLYVSESTTAERAVFELASKRGVALTTVAVSAHDKNEEKTARKVLSKASVEVRMFMCSYCLIRVFCSREIKY